MTQIFGGERAFDVAFSNFEFPPAVIFAKSNLKWPLLGHRLCYVCFQAFLDAACPLCALAHMFGVWSLLAFLLCSSVCFQNNRRTRGLRHFLINLKVVESPSVKEGDGAPDFPSRPSLTHLEEGA